MKYKAYDYDGLIDLKDILQSNFMQYIEILLSS